MVYYTLKGGERIATATVKRLLPPACARRALNKYNGTKAVQNYSLLAYNPAVGWHTLTDARLMKIDIVRGSAERGLYIWGWHNKLICSNQRRTIKWSPAANTPKAYKAAARGVLLYEFMIANPAVWLLVIHETAVCTRNSMKLPYHFHFMSRSRRARCNPDKKFWLAKNCTNGCDVRRTWAHGLFTFI